MNLLPTHRSLFQKSLIVALASFTLGIGFDFFFFGKELGINAPLYNILVLIVLFALSVYFKFIIDTNIIVIILPLVFFSTMMFVRTSELLIFLNIVACLLLLLLVADLLSKNKLRDYLLGDYVKTVFLPFQFVLPFLQTLFNIFTLKGLKKDTALFSQILRGLVLTIPVLVLFLLLFSSADLVFEKYLTGLFDLDIKPETIAHGVEIVFITCLFIGGFAYIFLKTHSLKVSSEDASPLKAIVEGVRQQDNSMPDRSVGRVELSILLGLLNLLFLAFILIQLVYLFGGESNISAQGFTYAEYARKGFFELVAVAVISFFMLWMIERMIPKFEHGHALWFQILGGALIVQVIVMMVSAFKRLALYESAYGFTTSRLYSHTFILFLAVVFLLLFYKIVRDSRENMFALRIFVTVTTFLVLMNLLNPDAFIARKNIERYRATGKVDELYLARLSDDALSQSVVLLDVPDESIKYVVGRELNRKRRKYLSENYWRWQAYNISRARASRILGELAKDLEKYSDSIPEVISTPLERK